MNELFLSYTDPIQLSCDQWMKTNEGRTHASQGGSPTNLNENEWKTRTQLTHYYYHGIKRTNHSRRPLVEMEGIVHERRIATIDEDIGAHNLGV